jgi:AcrR family transcriptional regulator
MATRPGAEPAAAGREPGGPPRLEPVGGEPAQGRELRARGRRTLRRLLDAGSEVFAERGYHAARVDDIVKLAKTSHGTFYLYFRNKEDLFRALLAEVAGDMEALAEGLGAVGTGEEARVGLRTWIEQFCDLYTRSGPVIRAWTEAEISTSEFGRLGEDVLGNFSLAVAKHARRGRNGLDANATALAVVAMLERLNYYVLTEQVPLDRAAMVDVLTDVTYRVLFA